MTAPSLASQRSVLDAHLADRMRYRRSSGRDGGADVRMSAPRGDMGDQKPCSLVCPTQSQQSWTCGMQHSATSRITSQVAAVAQEYRGTSLQRATAATAATPDAALRDSSLCRCRQLTTPIRRSAFHPIFEDRLHR